MQSRKIDVAFAHQQASTALYNFEDQIRLFQLMMTDAIGMARQATSVDDRWSEFADALTVWRDNARGSAPLPERVHDAIATVSEVCGEYGMDRGTPEELPLPPRTAEFGRISACRQIFFHSPDWSLYADGEEFTVDDCLAASESALRLGDSQTAFDLTVEAFFDLTPGFVCYGDDCWGPTDFRSP